MAQKSLVDYLCVLGPEVDCLFFIKEVSCTAYKPDWEEMGVRKFAFIPGAWEGNSRSPPRRKAKLEIWRTLNLLLNESPDSKEESFQTC